MPGAIELCKVLLVTDCSELRSALGFTLESQAEQVLTARNVREGKEMIAQHCDIDLVIADLLLPDGDGFALLRCVSLLEEPKPRVILIAGLPSPEDERRAPSGISPSRSRIAMSQRCSTRAATASAAADCAVAYRGGRC